MKAPVTSIAAVLAAMMLSIGTCCCGGAVLAAEVNAPKDECCAGKPPRTEHKDDCHCAGKVLLDAKQGASSMTAAVFPVSYILQGPHTPSFRACASHFVSSLASSAMERPPPHEIRRWLGIWLV